MKSKGAQYLPETQYMIMDFSSAPEKKVEPEKEFVPIALRKKTTDKKVEKDPLDEDYEGLKSGIEMEF